MNPLLLIAMLYNRMLYNKSVLYSYRHENMKNDLLYFYVIVKTENTFCKVKWGEMSRSIPLISWKICL